MNNLAMAISWKWPGAKFVTRGGVLERWDGPMAQPTEAEIAQAVVDYAADPNLPADINADAYYKDKNVLAMCGVILEKVDSAFTTTDTNAQKRTKVVALAVRFNQLRKWVERNYPFMVFP